MYCLKRGRIDFLQPNYFPPKFHFARLTLSYSSGHSPSPMLFWPSNGSNNLCSYRDGSNSCSISISNGLEGSIKISSRVFGNCDFLSSSEPLLASLPGLVRDHPLVYPFLAFMVMQDFPCPMVQIENTIDNEKSLTRWELQAYKGDRLNAQIWLFIVFNCTPTTLMHIHHLQGA